MNDGIDWKLLLTKYVNWVGICEGITFVPGTGGGQPPVRWFDWTPEEIAALQAIEAEDHDFYHQPPGCIECNYHHWPDERHCVGHPVASAVWPTSD